MAISSVIRRLNDFKKRKIIKDYSIFGGVATAAYMEPIYTEDVDVMVLVDTDDEFLRVFRALGKTENVYHVIDGTKVQLFPTTISSLYRDALLKSNKYRLGTFRTKVVRPEHLIMLLLTSFREKDKYRITRLLQSASRKYLNNLLRRFDDEEKTLGRKLQTIR